MPLRRLAALEAQELQDEYDELMGRIEDLRDILARPERVRAIIRVELSEIREEYADSRRSAIVPYDGDVTVEDLIPDQTVVVTLTSGGYLKRTPIDQYRAQRRGGKGVAAGELRDDDVVETLFTCGVKDILLFFTNEGRSYRIKAYQIPERGRASRGVYVANVSGLAFEPDEEVAAILRLETFEGDGRHLVFGTRNGTVKRTLLSEFDSTYSRLIAINLPEGDELISVRVSDGDQSVLMVSSDGQAIRFDENDARAMGRTATGVRGMRLRDDAHVLSMALAPMPPELDTTQELDEGDLSVLADEPLYLLTVTENGLGKRTPIEEYSLQNRGGQGNRTHRLTARTGQLAGGLVVPRDAEVMLVTDLGTIIRTPLEDVRIAGRSTQGVSMMRTEDQARVVSVAMVVEEDDVEVEPASDDAGEEPVVEGDVQVEEVVGDPAGSAADPASGDASAPVDGGTSGTEPAPEASDEP
jgi:DNA gyrase subunit A